MIHLPGEIESALDGLDSEKRQSCVPGVALVATDCLIDPELPPELDDSEVFEVVKRIVAAIITMIERRGLEENDGADWN